MTHLEALAKQLSEGREEDRSDHGPDHGGEATHHRDEHHLHREGDRKDGVRVHVAEIQSVEPSRQPGEEGRERERQHLGPHRVDADRLRGILVFPDGEEIGSQPCPGQPPGRQHGERRQGGDDEVEGSLAFPVEHPTSEPHRGQGGDQKPYRAVRERIPVQRDQSHDLRHGQRGEREIRPAQAETDQPDGKRDEHGGGAAQGHPVPGRQTEPEVEDHRRVRAHAEEGRVPEGDLTREAAEEIPRHAEQGPEQHRDGEVEEELIRRQEGRGHHQDGDAGDGGRAAHDLPTPKRPEGRKRSTSRKMTKPIVSL